METNVQTKSGPGRPVQVNSVRQQKLQKQKEMEILGKSLPKGRPSNPDSKRQKAIAEKRELKEAGGEIKVGRPKITKTYIPQKENIAEVV
jgi:hypothetical protein